jgi:homoserine dehydrogenase
MSDVQTRYYVRIRTVDQPGVLAQISRVFGDRHISISSAIQKETDIKSQTAEIVLMTHPAREAAMQQALAELSGLDVVKEVSNFIRVEA